ncbi:MAG: hypothetical protein ACI4JI_04035 [Ruminiclostridium sp.]
MKKLLCSFTALILALCTAGCSSSPDELPSELVSVDFGGSQSADLPESGNESYNQSQNNESDDEINQAYKKLMSLGHGNVICNSDHNVDYGGGTLELPCTIEYSCETEEMTEPMSTGCLVAINGVFQKVSCGEQKDEYMYVQTFEKDDFSKENGQYVSRKRIKLSFEPQINEEDKELTKLQLTVITVDNPLYRLEPEYPSAFLIHRTATSSILTITLNSPITNYTDDKISKDGFTELELTKEVTNEYANMVNIGSKHLAGNTAPFVNVGADGYSSFCFDENGKLDLGFITSVREDSETSCQFMAQGRYLISMFVNGSPHTFPDGSMYKSVDMVPGKLYVYETTDFSGILNECDTIVFLPVACLRDDGKSIMTDTVTARAILPKDKMPVYY